MSRNAGNASGATDSTRGDRFSTMKDFGFSGSLEGQPKSGAAAPKPVPRAKPSKPAPASNGLDDFTMGHTNPITGQDGFTAGKMPANGGYADGGMIPGPHMHPHGQSLHRVDKGMDGSIVHHHAHGGYTTFHQDGNITHHSADGQEAVGASAGPNGAGSVNTHPHGHAVVHTESMHDREILRHAHGGFTVHYNDGRDPTHHSQDGTPAYHSAAGHEDFARGGMVPSLHRPKPRKRAAPKAAAPIEGALSQAAPINRPPRNPQRSVTPRNEMPAGQMPYGVEPSAEPDVSQGTAGAAAGAPDATGLKKGGRSKA